ncbi:MAG: hypothetical protein JWR27_492 [Aeromicrobium sp.]|nr:hypothetical protein [Aeromicrobium sp.]
MRTIRRRWTEAARAARVVAVKLRNRRDARAFAARCRADERGAAARILVHFADGPENLYQLLAWTDVLATLRHPVGVLVTRPDTGRAVAARTDLPLVFAPGSADLERVVTDQAVELVIYVNHKDLNFRMLRFADPVHVFIGHGESDKDYSTSHQSKAYDQVWISGPAAADRLAARLRGYDVPACTRQVGRPQLDVPRPGAPDWPDDGLTRVFYAPTHEGDRPSMAYGSVLSHGVAMVSALVADGRFRVIYRPHPRTGLNDAATAAADRHIRELLSDQRHLIDDGPYGWQWDAADVCITDVSSVAYDWVATGKPVIVTVPTGTDAVITPSRLLDSVPRLTAAAAGDVVAALESATRSTTQAAALTAHYFGDTSNGASLARFANAVDDALAWRRVSPGSAGSPSPTTGGS